MPIAVEVARVSGAKLSGAFDHIKTTEQATPKKVDTNSGPTLMELLDETERYAKKTRRRILKELKKT